MSNCVKLYSTRTFTCVIVSILNPKLCLLVSPILQMKNTEYRKVRDFFNATMSTVAKLSIPQKGHDAQLKPLPSSTQGSREPTPPSQALPHAVFCARLCRVQEAWAVSFTGCSYIQPVWQGLPGCHNWADTSCEHRYQLKEDSAVSCPSFHCYLFCFVFNSKVSNTGKGALALSTQVFTQTYFFKQSHEVNCRLRNEQPKSIAVSEFMWVVICTNIKTPSMNSELLLIQ